MVETPEPRKAGIDPPAHGTRGDGRGRPLRAQAQQNLTRISIEGRSYVEKLNDIETPLATLIFRHERLRTTKLLSHLRLRQPFDIAQ